MMIHNALRTPVYIVSKISHLENGTVIGKIAAKRKQICALHCGFLFTNMGGVKFGNCITVDLYCYQLRMH